MVVLTVLTNSNDHTVYFDEPIEKFGFIRLISCSFYNSWYNLKERGEIGIFDDKNVGSVKRIYPGNYSLDTLGKKMKEIFDKEGIKVKLNDHEKGSIAIENPLGRKIIFDRDLSYLFDLIDSSQDKNFEKNNIPKAQRRYTLKKGDTAINRLVSFNNLFIKCDLVDKMENVFNEKPSNVLACFDIKGSPFERVEYSSKHSPFRKIAGGKKIIDSLRITVTEETGEVIDFNGLPLRFEFEII